MNILGINTSDGKCSVVIKTKNTSYTNKHKNHHPVEKLFITIESVMKKAKISVDNINAIAIVVGPGSFTGIRVALAAAIGIQKIINKPIVSLNALELFAFSKRRIKSSKYIVSIIDANKNQFYFQIYNTDIQPISQAILIDLPSLLEKISKIKEDIAIVTNANRDLFNNFNISKPNILSMCSLALEKLKNGMINNNELIYIRSLYVT